MDNLNIYALLLSGILEDDRELIFSIYDTILDDKITDKDIVIKMMMYMYSLTLEEQYITLLKHISSKLNNSEIAYFIGFYFLIKNSSQHAYLAFKKVKEYDSKYYYQLAQHNIRNLENTNTQLTRILKNSLEDAMKNEPDNNILKKQLNNLNDIEKKISETVNLMIEYAKGNDKKKMK